MIRLVTRIILWFCGPITSHFLSNLTQRSYIIYNDLGIILVVADWVGE